MDALGTLPTKLYFHGDPSNDEQYLLELVNRGRSDPYNECKLMLDSHDPAIDQAIVGYRVDIRKLFADFASYAPKPPLALNPKLSEAARIQAQDMATHDFQDHIGSDGSTLADRFTRVGYPFIYGGENVFAYAQSVFSAEAAFLIDWGVPDLGHRINLLDLGDHTGFREIGLCILSESKPATMVGPLVVAQEFGLASQSTVFITGVVYRDKNGNNFYDPGEGLGGVQIMPDSGDYYAVTGASGGYTIPVSTRSGRYILTASRQDLATLTQEVTVGTENVKADFITAGSALGVITGSVADQEANTPVKGVTVTLQPVGTAMVTGDNGEFTFINLAAGTYTVTVARNDCQFPQNSFTVNLAAGQEYRLRVLANDPLAPPPGSDTDLDPVGSPCGTAGFALIFLAAAASVVLWDSQKR